MNYIQQLGPLAIASRMKNLSDQFMRDMEGIYKRQGVDFEPRWFTFLFLLYERGPHTITSIARELNQTHPAANQVANILEQKGYVRSTRDKNDKRKRILILSPAGLALINRLQVLWQTVEKATSSLLRMHSPNLLSDIGKLEAGLRKSPIKEIILNQYDSEHTEELRILDYTPAFKNEFKKLNELWLEEYFEVEEADKNLLDNPEKAIIDRGGMILFATVGDKVAGTGALLRISGTVCELTKMAVAPSFQGRQLGRLLLRNLIHRARHQGFERMILLTSEKLDKAVNLYKSEGFRLSDSGSVMAHNLKRCSIQMEINLINAIIKNDKR